MNKTRGKSGGKPLIQAFDYEIKWSSTSLMPGLHKSTVSGAGAEFERFAPLRLTRDPKRFDILATLRNPTGEDWGRVNRQISGITVYEIADLSASMGFWGETKKNEILAQFSASLAYSVYRAQDQFGFIGCDTEVLEDFFYPPLRIKGVAYDLGERLLEYVPRGRDEAGLLEAADLVGGKRSLVFLVSDFHFSFETLKKILGALTVLHEVVPVVIHDSAEFENIPRWGLAWLRDPETGEARLEFFTPWRREKIRRGFEERKERIKEICRSFEARPFFLTDEFIADKMTKYFLD